MASGSLQAASLISQEDMMATRRPNSPSKPESTPVSLDKTAASSPAKATSAKKTATKSASKSAPLRADISEGMRRSMIAEAAYLRAEQRGFAGGDEVEDWLAAEAEVDALLKSGGTPQ